MKNLKDVTQAAGVSPGIAGGRTVKKMYTAQMEVKDIQELLSDPAGTLQKAGLNVSDPNKVQVQVTKRASQGGTP